MSMEGSSSFGFNSLIPQTYKSKAEAFAKCLQDKLMLLGGLNEGGNDKKRLNETELNGNKKPDENFPYDISKFSEDNIFVQHPESLIKRDIPSPENRNIGVPKINGKLKYIKDRRGYSSDSEESDRDDDLYKKTENAQDQQKIDEFYQNGSDNTSDLVLNSHKQSELLHKRVHELINGNNEKSKENRKLVSLSSEETNDSWHSCDDHDAYDSDDNEEVDYFASQIKGSPKLRSTKLRNRKRGYKDDEGWKKSSRENYSPVIAQDVFADFDTECFSPVEDPEEEQLIQINDNEEVERDQNLVLLDGVDMENYDVPYRILRESSSANNLEKHFSQSNLEIDPIIVGDTYLRKKDLIASPVNLKPPSPDGYSHLLTPPPSPEVNRNEMLSSGDFVMNMKNFEELNGYYEELEEEEEDVQEVKEKERLLMGIAEEAGGEESIKVQVEEGETAEIETDEQRLVDSKNMEESVEVIREGKLEEDVRENIKTEELKTEEEEEIKESAAEEEDQPEIEEKCLEVTTDECKSEEDTKEVIETDLASGEVETDETALLEAAEERIKDEEAATEIDANQSLLTELTKEEPEVETASPEEETEQPTLLEVDEKRSESETERSEKETEQPTLLKVDEKRLESETERSEEETEQPKLLAIDEKRSESAEDSSVTNDIAIKTEINGEINYAEVISEPSNDQTDEIQEIETSSPPNFCSTFNKKGGMVLECPCDTIQLPTLELYAPEESQSTCSIEVQIYNEEEPKNETDSPVDSTEEPSNDQNSGNALTVPNDKSEDDDNEEMLSPRLKLRRCSSLKTWKTPPGTPGRKKIVRFADALGLDLADVRTFLDEIPKIPSSAYEDLNYDLNSDPFSSCHCPAPQLPTMPTLIPMFPQPGGQIDFLERVKTLNISLESAVLTDTTVLTISGIIRVRNLDFNKSVHVRYSLDNWVTISDLQATYVPNSCDGFSDKFSFVLYGHTLKIGQQLEFALRLECLGCHYWDNNSGKNYVFQCLPASPSTAVYTPLSSSPADTWTSKFY